MAGHGKVFDMQIKILMIGDSGVGKTCLLLRYANQSFSPTFITTIGIDFKIKNIELDGKRIKLQIWDTAGQERFRTITTSYFRGAQGILLVYDVADRSASPHGSTDTPALALAPFSVPSPLSSKASFNSIRNWIAQIQQHADINVNKILVANKCDVESRKVSTEEGEKLAAEYGVQFFETSAKADLNVETAFEGIAREVKTRLLADGLPQDWSQGQTVNPNQQTTSNRPGCCK
jgi:Ras-related protein Rab-8A